MKNYSYRFLCGSILVILLLMTGLEMDDAQAAVSYRSSSTTCNATSNTSVNVPTGTVDGDVMIMVINSKNNSVQATPTGWTRIGTQLNNTSSLTSSVFYRVADSEPASYAPTTSAVAHCLGISTFSGVDISAPINASSQRANGFSSTITANAITPTVPNSTVLFISSFANDVTHSSYLGSNPSFSERFDARTSSGSDIAIAMASGTKSDTTSTGNRSAQASGGGAANIGYLIALAPVPPAPINVSGTCKQADNTTGCSDTGTMRVAVNGVLQTQTQEVVGGTWNISGITQPASGAVITVFVDGVVSSESRAVAATTYDGSGDVAGLELVEGALSLGNNDNRTITNNNLSQYDNSVSGDADVFHEVNGNLTVDANGSFANELLYIKSGNTYAPGGSVTTASFRNNGTFTAGANTVNFASATGTNSIAGNLINGSAFYKVSFDTTGSATWTIQNAMKVSAANASDTFVIRNGAVTLGDSNGDNLEVSGRMIIAGAPGETGTFQTLPLSDGNITIDVNANTSTPTCGNCVVSVGAPSGSGQGSFKIAKNTILRLNPRAAATTSDTGIEVESTGYLEVLGSQETTNTVYSISEGPTSSTITVSGTPWTDDQLNGMTLRIMNPASLAFGRTYSVIDTTPNTLVINAVTSAQDSSPDVQGATNCSGNSLCTISVADSMLAANFEHTGRYLHNLTDDDYYRVSSSTEETTDVIRIITYSPDNYSTMNDGDLIEITDGIRASDSFEVLDYAHVTAETGTACTSPVNQAGEAYITAKSGSETIIRYAQICNLGRGVQDKMGLQFNGVDGSVANQGLTIEKSLISNNLRGILMVGSKNNDGGKGLMHNTVSGNFDAGIYLNTASWNAIESNNINKNGGVGILIDASVAFGQVLNNRIFDNGNNGIYANAPQQILFEGNYIYNNGWTATGMNMLIIGGANNTVKSNIIHSAPSTEGQGLAVLRSPNITIAYNTFYNNRRSGFVIDDTFGATSYGNVSYNNYYHGMTTICGNPTANSGGIFFKNSFYSNIRGHVIEHDDLCTNTLINESYGILGPNQHADVFFGFAFAPVMGNFKINSYNSSFGSAEEFIQEGPITTEVQHFISKKHNGVAGETRIWKNYSTPAQNIETPQNEALDAFNYAGNLWEKSVSPHMYSGAGTEDTDLNYDVTLADLSAGPYHYRIVARASGDCTTAVFDIFRNLVDVGDVNCGVQFTDSNNFKFKVDGGAIAAYATGDTYTFTAWDASNDANTQKNVKLMTDRDSFTVPVDATLELKGESALLNPTLITRGSSGGYQFAINGTLDANSYKFDYLGGTGQTAGLLLNSGANIISLDNGNFDNFGVNNGTSDAFIEVNGNLIGSGTPQKTITNLNFENSTGHANCNLNASGTASGYWELLLSLLGSFSGENFDCANGTVDPVPGNFNWIP